MKLLILNGPNLNLLGLREPDIYGSETYEALCRLIDNEAERLNIDVQILQSNHEGILIDAIQEAYQQVDGIIINPAAYTHTSVALLDALKAVGLPTIEVHLSDVQAREDFRKKSYIRAYAVKTIAGKGFQGYLEAMQWFVETDSNEK